MSGLGGAARTLGIVGGGQLAQMLALAALPLGVRVKVLEPDPEAPARLVATHLHAAYTDAAALDELARCDAVTLEFENVPLEALARLSGRVPVRPAPQVLELSGHRAREKQALNDLGISTAPFRSVNSAQEAGRALAELGGEGLLKTARLGYDGKGQRRVRSAAEAGQAFEELNAECVLEGLVPFVRELSLAVARSPAGQLAFGGLMENVHREGILWRSVYPAASGAEVQARARELAARAAQAWQLAGLITFEFFELAGGELLVNEIAPRVHNSGHLTQDAGGTSQFEAQVRAVLDLPLQDFAPLLPCAMVNVLGWSGQEPGGQEPDWHEPDWTALLSVPGARLHLYHKANRPGRKLGHVNLVAPGLSQVLAGAARVEALLAATRPHGTR